MGCYSFTARDFHSVLDVNWGGGSVHVHRGRNPQSWPEWAERMLADPRSCLDSAGDVIGLAAPKSMPTIISLRYISKFLTHTVGRLETWKCRNGFCDTSGYGGGKQETWFNSFPSIEAEQPPKRLADGRLQAAYCYWFFLKKSEPVLCIDTDGHLYKMNGDVHHLVASDAEHKRI